VPTTASEDRIHRERVLMFLLHEARLATVEEIVVHRLAFEKPEAQKQCRDGTERAVKELTSFGVLNHADGSVYVSLAARTTARVMDPCLPEFTV
jgi:hypothetical protein